jgi:transposase InsO family protein
VHSEKANHKVSVLCRVLGLSRSGYHKWAKSKPSRRKRENTRLAAEIRGIHRTSRERYGSPRIHAELNARGQLVGKKRVARIMRENGIKARPKRRFRLTTDSAHAFPVAPNLLDRNFAASAPNEAWVGDITYVWTLEGWMYLAVLIDLHSRAVVGWALSERMTRGLALDALDMAIARRRPGRGLLHHTDRGSQYASAEYRTALEAHGIVCSMSRKGNCWDNAVAESFFATLKKELVHEMVFFSRAIACAHILEFIEVFYNRQRRHSALNYMTPAHFELARSPQLAA